MVVRQPLLERLWQQQAGRGRRAGRVSDRHQRRCRYMDWAHHTPKHRQPCNLGRAARNTGFSRDYGRNPYSGYDRADIPPFLFAGDLDGRLLPKERVVAVTIDDGDAAFPFSVLENSAGGQAYKLSASNWWSTTLSRDCRLLQARNAFGSGPFIHQGLPGRGSDRCV